jgi:hypothetical protein
MKAIVQTRYGSPDVLQLRDRDTPMLKDDEVLLRVHAAAVNIGGKGLAAAIRGSGSARTTSRLRGVRSGGLGSGPVERAGQQSALDAREPCLLSCC